MTFLSTDVAHADQRQEILRLHYQSASSFTFDIAHERGENPDLHGISQTKKVNRIVLALALCAVWPQRAWSDTGEVCHVGAQLHLFALDGDQRRGLAYAAAWLHAPFGREAWEA